MSIFKKALGTFLTIEEDPLASVDANKPLADQVQESSGKFTVFNGNVGVSNTTPVPAPTAVSEEDKKKLELYFEQLYEKTNCPKPSYHEFIAIAEAFSDLPANTRFPKALNSFKGKLSKDVLLHTAKMTLTSIKQDADEYNAVVAEKIAKEVGIKKQNLKNLQEQVAKLQQEIANLSQEIQVTEMELEQKAAGYNSFSANVQAKIDRDIRDIESFV